MSTRSQAVSSKRKGVFLVLLGFALIISLTAVIFKIMLIYWGTKEISIDNVDDFLLAERFSKGVLILLLHTDEPEVLVNTLKLAYQSWRKFLLNQIDLYLVLSSDFPIGANELTEDLGMSINQVFNGTYQFKSTNYEVRIKENEFVIRTPYSVDTLYTCKGPNDKKGFSRFYVEGNAWYTYQLFRDHGLFLKNYSFFLKIDYDVFLFKPIYSRIINAFSDTRTIFIHAGLAVHHGCANKFDLKTVEYLRSESREIKTASMSAYDSKGNKVKIHLPSESDVYYGNFVGGTIRFFGSSEVLKYAEFLFRTNGYFLFRWTDQAYWHNALGVHIKNFQARVYSMEDLRFKPGNLPSGNQAILHKKKLSGKILNLYTDRLEMSNIS
mmetsp:Transcript_1043/g.3839  ORF Transcript_1043/g.3839 Transcript_1043/m.3839 type:complete len:381 (+) Transcript_1043:272-1414(+)